MGGIRHLLFWFPPFTSAPISRKHELVCRHIHVSLKTAHIFAGTYIGRDLYRSIRSESTAGEIRPTRVRCFVVLVFKSYDRWWLCLGTICHQRFIRFDNAVARMMGRLILWLYWIENRSMVRLVVDNRRTFHSDPRLVVRLAGKPTIDRMTKSTVYPKKYAHGFVVLCFVVVM